MAKASTPPIQKKFLRIIDKNLPTFKKIAQKIQKRVSKFLSRRPHRSFKKTDRRDHKRSLKLPGYFAFSSEVFGLLMKHKKIFMSLAFVFALFAALSGQLASQSNYSLLTDTFRETSQEAFNGDLGKVGDAGVIFVTILTGGLSPELDSAQQILSLFISVMVWLATIWLLREIVARRKVKLRDGLYASGSPILATIIITLVIIVQLIPIAVAAIGYGAAQSSGILSGGVEAMLFWAAAALLTMLSIYWISSTFIALVIVTLPGMYPMRALSIAGDIVVGRRLRIILRLLWMVFGVVVWWALIMLPIIIFDTWLKGATDRVDWLPLIPTALLILSSFTLVWISAYVYLLYRKVVDDDAKPA